MLQYNSFMSLMLLLMVDLILQRSLNEVLTSQFASKQQVINTPSIITEGQV